MKLFFSDNALLALLPKSPKNSIGTNQRHWGYMMTYNLQEDWNQFKKVTAQLMDVYRYSSSCQIWNNDMTNLVNEYKQEEAAWYNSLEITENGFMTATQNLWYTHYLNKRCLMSLGLTAHYDYIQPTKYEKGENQRYPYWDYRHDGKNLICKISDSMNYRKTFYDRNHCVWADERRNSPGEYYIIHSRSVNGNYICPSCGWEGPLECFVDGCDYCQTKFHIEDLKQKVSSVYTPGDWTQHRDGFTIHKNFVPMYVALAIIVIALLAIGSNMGGAMMMLAPLLGIVVMVLVMTLFIGKNPERVLPAVLPEQTRHLKRYEALTSISR